ncbi:hypothetical protein EJB05_52418, partial [Eragrostis curvula]
SSLTCPRFHFHTRPVVPNTLLPPPIWRNPRVAAASSYPTAPWSSQEPDAAAIPRRPPPAAVIFPAAPHLDAKGTAFRRRRLLVSSSPTSGTRRAALNSSSIDAPLINASSSVATPVATATLAGQGSTAMVMSSPCSSRTKKRPSSPAPEARDWAALPHDALLEVFLRLDAHDIMWSAEVVCKAWRRVAVEEPMLWRRVDMTRVPLEDMDTAVYDAVDRSAGQMEAFSGPWDDELLVYLGDRAPSLKSLHLSYDDDATDEILMLAIKKFPLLEDLDISPPFYDLSAADKLFESVCKACPLLKNLKIKFIPPPYFDFDEAILMECVDGDIYRTPMMRELRSLELLNYVFSKEQLTAILDNCPLLESLRITGHQVDEMDAQLQEKCARVKHLTIPFYTTEKDSGHSDSSDNSENDSEDDSENDSKNDSEDDSENDSEDDSENDSKDDDSFIMPRFQDAGMSSFCSRRRRTKKRPSQTHSILIREEVVCKAWRRVAVEEPMLWRRVDTTEVPLEGMPTAMCDAVDRSGGLMEAFSGHWGDYSLLFIDARAESLKSLHLSYNDNSTDEIFMLIIKKLPLLEDLNISPLFYDLSAADKLFETVCKACPLLKNLKIRFTPPPDFDFDEALLMECVDGDIYRTPMMCELRSLELFNYVFSKEQLTAILDNCPQLESLHITGHQVDAMDDAQLQAKCARVKKLTIPFYTTEKDSGHSDSSEDDSENDSEDDDSFIM